MKVIKSSMKVYTAKMDSVLLEEADQKNRELTGPDSGLIEEAQAQKFQPPYNETSYLTFLEALSEPLLQHFLTSEQDEFDVPTFLEGLDEYLPGVFASMQSQPPEPPDRETPPDMENEEVSESSSERGTPVLWQEFLASHQSQYKEVLTGFHEYLRGVYASMRAKKSVEDLSSKKKNIPHSRGSARFGEIGLIVDGILARFKRERMENSVNAQANVAEQSSGNVEMQSKEDEKSAEDTTWDCRFEESRYDTGSSSSTPEVDNIPGPKEKSLPAEVVKIPVSILKKVVLDTPEEESAILKIRKIPVSILKNALLDVTPEEEIEILQLVNSFIGEDGPTDKYIPCIYSRLMRHVVVPDKTSRTDWRPYYGPVKDQKGHQICWAIVAAELVSALRRIKGRDEVVTEYSYQELVELVCSEKLKRRKNDHYCYRLNIMQALLYIKKYGIQKATDQPFECREDPPDRVLSDADLGYIGDAKSIPTIEEALVQLQNQPIGASMPIFQPDYDLIGGDIYRGPMLENSMFGGMHAVSITGAGTENGESFAHVRSSHGQEKGKLGYFRVSLDVLIQRISKGQKYEEKYFKRPTRLLERFRYPELLEESQEKAMKKTFEAQIAKESTSA